MIGNRRLENICKDEDVVNGYISGLSTRKVADRLGICQFSVLKILKRNGIKIRESRRWKHDFNDGYFDVIDNSEKAYWVGFILADGSISRPNAISIMQKERYILEEFSRAIGCKTEIIKEKENKACFYDKNGISRETNGKIFYLYIRSNKMFNALENMGICQRKSFVEVGIPRGIEKFEGSFLRGLFDGDGCVLYWEEISKK